MTIGFSPVTSNSASQIERDGVTIDRYGYQLLSKHYAETPLEPEIDGISVSARRKMGLDSGCTVSEDLSKMFKYLGKQIRKAFSKIPK